MEKVTDTIEAIGVDDHDIDLFESQYPVPEGISYNSYLIHDDKNTVMDTVDHRKQHQWLENLHNALNGEKVDYLVINHMEPDHSGSISALVEEFPDMKLVGNAKTFNMLKQFQDIKDLESKKIVVKEGDELNTGKHTLSFHMAPMVHWPEVMVTYDKKDKALFSADAFGTFDTFDGKHGWDDEARRYFLNIVGKYGPMVQALLKKAQGLDIEMILPLHGPVLKDNLAHYIGLYNTWSKYQPEEKGVFIAYASIHGNTAKAAEMLRTMLEERNVKVEMTDLARMDKSYAIANAFRYPVMILMASSYDAHVFPPMQTFLTTLGIKNYQNRTIGLIQNGSWAPSALKIMKEDCAKFKNITYLEPEITIKSSVSEANIQEMKTLADHAVKALD